MSKVREQFCFNCGESLGHYATYSGDKPEACGEAECQRELRYATQAEYEERAERAREDGYGRY